MRFSQDGFLPLAEGHCHLACTDRRPTPREHDLFAAAPIRGHRLAFYGYALYVHPDNPLDAVLARHLRPVFARRITDWRELSGGRIPGLEGPIRLYGPPKGTRAGMVLSPLANIWFAEATWQVLERDTDIVARVAADPLALGFAGIGYDDGVRYLGLQMDPTTPPAFPSLEEIESERYGLAKLIYIYHADPPAPPVQAALAYLFSEPARAALAALDVWPVAPERAALPTVR